jgi:ribosomal protein S18 acetylase RimI-like enzyme
MTVVSPCDFWEAKKAIIEAVGLNSPIYIRLTKQNTAVMTTEKTENENYFVAKVNGKVVGFCFVTKNEERNQLSAIYILPEFQGKGLGKSLWESASSFIDTSKDTFVDVVTYNTQAIEFYKKLGFVDTGRRWSEEKFKMKSGGVLPEMEMVIRANKSFTTTSIA